MCVLDSCEHNERAVAEANQDTDTLRLRGNSLVPTDSCAGAGIKEPGINC